MKTTKFLSLLLITALSLSSCGDDEDEPITETNSNRNNTVVCKDADRLEFPHL